MFSGVFLVTTLRSSRLIYWLVPPFGTAHHMESASIGGDSEGHGLTETTDDCYRLMWLTGSLQSL